MSWSLCTCNLPDFQHAICPVHDVPATAGSWSEPRPEPTSTYGGVQVAPAPKDGESVAGELSQSQEIPDGTVAHRQCQNSVAAPPPLSPAPAVPFSLPLRPATHSIYGIDDAFGVLLGEILGEEEHRYVIAAVNSHEELKREKDAAYAERDNLVCALSKIFPSSLERHPDSDTTWDDDWRWIVFIDLPTGQATWHIHDSELPMFDHLPRFVGKTWDGHTTPQKYLRLAALQDGVSAAEQHKEELLKALEEAEEALKLSICTARDDYPNEGKIIDKPGYVAFTTGSSIYEFIAKALAVSSAAIAKYKRGDQQ